MTGTTTQKPTGNLPPEARQVLDFWFSELSPGDWFARSDKVDSAISERFEDLHTRLAEEVPQSWLASPHGTLAAIIVLDQFSRNLFRDDGRAFAQDETALALCKAAIDAGADAALEDQQKPFLYMPLMHSEVIADVHQCTDLMESAGAQNSVEFSRRHASTLERFGRYPARNTALGRASSEAEVTFLKENPHGF